MIRLILLVAGILLSVGLELPVISGAIAAESAVSYVPPVRGAPVRRIGGASRGADQNLPRLVALTPEHAGYTLKEQPTLYWYISGPTQVKVEITLIEEGKENALVEMPIDKVTGPAIHALPFAKLGIRLKKGVEYQWTVALVPNENERSNDVISGGVIKLWEGPIPAGTETGGQPASLAQAEALARGGIWYDAMETLNVLAAVSPSDEPVRRIRKAFLEDAGLSDVTD